VQVITLLAQRETTLLAAAADVTKAKLEREARVTAKQTEIITAKLKAESARATRLTQARSEVNKAQSERLARLTEARVRNSEATLKAERSRGVVLIEAATMVRVDLLVPSASFGCCLRAFIMSSVLTCCVLFHPACVCVCACALCPCSLLVCAGCCCVCVYAHETAMCPATRSKRPRQRVQPN